MQETPATLHPLIHRWLWLLCAMVLVMVLLGGATRLTGSGLSMVEWQPLHVLPPFSAADWQALFERYQQTPQFRLRNADMSVTGFEGIFWLEYIHRLWGRAMALVLAVPLALFWWRRMIPAWLVKRLLLVLLLGGLQGLVGWLMVASGLRDQPEVSAYRLALHLGLALTLYGLLLWTSLTCQRGHSAPPPSRSLPLWVLLCTLAMVVLTMLAGAFVAGLDAGLVYNTFPLMGEAILPVDWYSVQPWWRNLFENASAVQFNHRLLAISTVLLCLGLWLYARLTGRYRSYGMSLSVLAVFAGGQAGLGIATLLLVVPVPLAVAHQAGAFLVFSAVVWVLARGRT
ncbi:COX15/CtaA family protein [Insolitispirillum peregrinum]|uniref:Heme A synthase n=1 Tax=Insolitispirillum peregrinum TaxID=80876 RepID=A0A1N7PVW5_9PROT|nr:COX15/CtaA family protein [Insolitispirillum peregrinum]SIT14702.1 cytochrome c oxidase assembly protein subunit 15 [Insolitispirillum peregrinum]